MVICLDQGSDLHMAQLMPLPLTVSCFSEIQIGFTFLVLAHPGSPGKKAVKRVCVCVCVFLPIRYCCRVINFQKQSSILASCGVGGIGTVGEGSAAAAPSFGEVEQCSPINIKVWS